jgi:hypothetical protein
MSKGHQYGNMGVMLRTYRAVFESVTRILPGAAPAFLFRPGLSLSPLSITISLLPSATDGPALVKSDWGSGVLVTCVSFVIGVRLEVDMVSRMDTESSRAVEPEAAATADALSEVETIGLGGAGSSGEKKRLEDEAKAIGFDGPACCDEDGWLCAEEKSNDSTILTGGKLGIEISISDLNRCKWDTIYLAFNE